VKVLLLFLWGGHINLTLEFGLWFDLMMFFQFYKVMQQCWQTN